MTVDPRAILRAHAGAARDLATRPEAWLRPALLLAVTVTLAWSIGDARWVLGFGDLTPFLAAAVGLGFGLAFVGVRCGWSRLRVHLVVAAAGGLVLPVLVGLLLRPDAAPIVGWFQVASDSVTNAGFDLLVRRLASTPERGHVLLILAVECWAIGQLAGRVAAERLVRSRLGMAQSMGREVAGPTVLVGVLLIVNMVQVRGDQLEILVTFTTAALLLVMVERLAESRDRWSRRGYESSGQPGAFHLGVGGLVLAAAVIASTVLGQSAIAMPLGGAARDVSQRVLVLAERLTRDLPGPRLNVQGSRPQATITGRWITDPRETFRIRMSNGSRPESYWLVETWDTYTPIGWLKSESDRRDLGPGASLADQLSALENRSGGPVTTVIVEPANPNEGVVVSPGIPRSVDKPSRLILRSDGLFGSLDVRDGPAEYTVTAQMPYRARDDASAADLRRAGTDYPQAIRDRYLDVPDGTIAPGSDAESLLAELRFSSDGATPYDFAAWTERLFTSQSFDYTNDVEALCADLDPVECIARHRKGYCVYYASAMAMLLREMGIPTRVVTGFLPGSYDRITGESVVRGSDRHAWVQVYFPGTGWVDFDPTNGAGNRLPRIADPMTGPGASPRPSTAPEASRGPRASRRPSPSPTGAAGPVRSGSAGGLGPIMPAVGLLAVLVVGALVIATQRRRRRGDTARGPAEVFGAVVRFASRLGFRPRPSETVYEYSGALGVAVPGARPALELVAHATVESRYARRLPAPDVAAALAAAERRLRRQLLRLALRRGERRRR